MLVLGVDPGYAACGLALIDHTPQRCRALQLETVRTEPSEQLKARLHTVWRRAGHVIYSRSPPPAVLAIEAQARAQAGARERGTTSYEALAVREVVGLLRALAWQHGLALVEVEPATWRACLGLRVTAEKAQVKRAVRAVFGWTGRLSEHAAEAAGVGLAGARYFSSYGLAARN
jgi:Holliday junction resolvasome RuvABC endonuclease subunit